MNKVYSTGKLIINKNVLKGETNSLEWSYLVMDMYGKTISTYSRLFKNSKVNSVCLLTNLIDRLKYIHLAGFVHNDIKPDNICFEKEEANFANSAIRLIDFGETTTYINSKGVFYKKTDRCKHTGNILISSCIKLENKFLSRKDDMLGLAYMIFFLIDSLPYQNYYFENINKLPISQVKSHLYLMKVKAIAEDYCTEETLFLLLYLEEVFAMDYESKPNYKKVKIPACQITTR